MKLLFVTRKFEAVAGGLERMAIHLMNAVVEHGHDVTLFTWDKIDSKAFYPMNKSIEWFQLDMGNPDYTAGMGMRMRRMRTFRRLSGSVRPDVVIGFQYGAFLFAAVSLLGANTPVILAERTPPTEFDHTSEGRYRRLIYQTMRLAPAITVQNESYVAFYPSYLRPRITVIPNPVFDGNGFADPVGGKERRTLLSVGRLAYAKNYPVLLRAFARVADEFPDWRLKLVGEGEDRPALESLINDLEIGRRVSMDGASSDVSSEYRAADLFCLPSRWEGFPNALAEAMAHGLPVVAFAGCAGAAELITSDRDGRLAGGNGDTDSLALTLRELMGNAQERGRLGFAARDITQRYHPEKIYDMWEQLFNRVKFD
jgi:GalNAc-alpha-(1->4)-GalNAc-alpha-(1->3)-diNAcBac-PP-undecaprenol alpha-1,4-N-acetyl-D-galactosaminyltransferase